MQLKIVSMKIEYHKPLSNDKTETQEQAIVRIKHDTHENLFIYQDGQQIRWFRGDINRITIHPDFGIEKVRFYEL